MSKKNAIEEEKKEVISPAEVIEPTEKDLKKVQEIHLKRGEVLLEIISGKDKGKLFKTTQKTAIKYFSDKEVYQEVKKNI